MKKQTKSGWFGRNVFLKNIVLIVCTLAVMIFLAHLFLNIFTHHDRHVVVPDFAGMTLAEALEAGSGGKLRVEVTDSVFRTDSTPGVILSQRPVAFTEVKSGRRVAVLINAHQPLMVRIPYVTGVSLRQATNDLKAAGFEVGEIVYRPDIATDYVLETQYGGRTLKKSDNAEAPAGSKITLVVGHNSNG